MARAFTVVNVEQRSPEWHQSRAGRLTASRAADMLAKDRSGKGWGVSRTNLRMQLALERIAGRSLERDFSTPAMRDGVEREPLALGAYEALTGTIVNTCGFLQHNEIPVGCSPDGYLGDFDALVSIKCRNHAHHLDALKGAKIPNDAYWQIVHELWITGAKEHHYFSYQPDFPERLQSKLVVVPAASIDFAAYELNVLAFLGEVDQAVAEIKALEGAA